MSGEHGFAPRLAPWLATALAACSQPPSSGETGDLGADTSGESTTDDESGSETETETETETGVSDLPPDPGPLPDPMVVMTFNVLCSFCDDSYEPWEDRVGYISDTIARHGPDLIGLQELFTADEVDQLLALNPGYDALYYSDDSSDYADATIGWRSDRYEPIESGFYWLSPAPDTPFSIGFSPPQLPRIVAWVVLRELATEAEFLFVDTHFDNNSPSQELSAPLFLERTEAAGGELPIVAVGDFNSKPDSLAYGILSQGVDGVGFALTDSFEIAESWSVDSNEDPPTSYDPSVRIDHIWVAGGNWSVPWWVVDTWVYGVSNLHTSDHFAIAAQLWFEGA